jgi:hypothetical protein
MLSFQRCVVILLVACVFAVSGCASPVVYRPEVEGFQKATAEMSAFVTAKRSSVREVRAKLRSDELAAKRPLLRLSNACRATIDKLGRLSEPGKSPLLTEEDVARCRLEPAGDAGDSGDLAHLLNPPTVLDASVAFAAAVSTYAESLNKVATAGDRASFVEAVDGLATSARSVAVSSMKAAGKEPPDLDALTPIARVAGLAVSYYLEDRRADALKDAADAADPWIDQGSAGVARALYAAQFEVVRARRDELLEQLDEVNEASPAGYVVAADKAIALAASLREALASDPGAPLQALPRAHEKLREAFEDRKRLLPGTIAASNELYEAAREAREALMKDR